MLSVSTTATWSRTAVIHAGCDRYFWAFAFASHASCNLARCLTRATRDTRVGRQRFAVCSFHHPLTFGCRSVPTRSLAGTLGHTSWCNLLTWYYERKSQPLSRQCFTRDTWHRTSPSSSPSSQPGTCLAATVSTTPAPDRGATP